MTVVPVGPSAAAAGARGRCGRTRSCACSRDRDIQGGGIEVEFFGERTTLPGGPATLGLRTGAPVVPTTVYFTSQRDGHHAIIRPPSPRRAPGFPARRRHEDHPAPGRELEVLIPAAPQQWHLFQPNWPSDPGYQGHQAK